MFLYSDLEYEWPIEPGEGPGLLENLLTLGVAGRKWRREFELRMRAVGDWDLWPFFRRSDFDDCLRRPRLLAGTS